MQTADWSRTTSRKVPANSIAAYAFALVCVVLAAAIRIGFGWLGADLLFATNFVAVLIAALVAGPAAGGLAILLSLLTVWFAFMEPRWQVSPIGLNEAANMLVFAASSSVVVWIASSYRNLIHTVDANNRERDLVMSELTHRGRNTYAVVDAIVRMTLDDLPERARQISDRVRAVSSTNDLINAAPTHRIALRTLLEKEFMPHGPARLSYHGEPIELDSMLARNLALIFHEMVTNAAKYGALSTKEGKVDVTCDIDGSSVSLRWKETGGPPVTQPAAYGFGSRLVTRTLSAMSGTIKPEFASSGLICDITFARSEADAT